MSALADHLEDYLRLRRGLGHELADAHRLLPRFVAYLNERGLEFVTIEAALSWSLDAAPAGSVVPGHKWTHVRGFARYLSGIDPRTEIPPAGMVRIPRRWRPPFVYSDSDVLALMQQARSIPQPLRAATYETLIGLLAATGVRIGEALRLDQAISTGRRACCGSDVRSSRSHGWCRSQSAPWARLSAMTTRAGTCALSRGPGRSSCRCAAPV
jgi:site-specific recombinase XerD